MLLGVLVQFVVHAVGEIVYIKLLRNNFEVFGLGLSWDMWFTIHGIYTIVLLIVGVGLGFQQGKYWWKRVYGL